MRSDQLYALNIKLQKIIDSGALEKMTVIEQLASELHYANLLKEVELGLIDRTEILKTDIYVKRRSREKKR